MKEGRKRLEKPLRKIPTPQSLANVALHYLGRYAASEASLRRVLDNRLRRVAMQRPEFAADSDKQTLLRAEIEKIIESHKNSGAVNDSAFADIKINSLRRQGRSRRLIEQKLQAKGIARPTLAAALERHQDGQEAEDVELKAALTLAKKRKLGPFRATAADYEQKRKDFAVMARAGFSSSIISQALNAEFTPDEEWE